jgi:hypothetical protein
MLASLYKTRAFGGVVCFSETGRDLSQTGPEMSQIGKEVS